MNNENKKRHIIAQNWTPFPNHVLDNLHILRGAELYIYAFMIRKTIGWNFSKHDSKYQFAVRYLMRHLRMGSTTIQKGLQGLLKKELIFISKESDGSAPTQYNIALEIPTAVLFQEEVTKKHRGVPVSGTVGVPETGTSKINKLKEIKESSGKSSATTKLRDGLKLKTRRTIPVYHPYTIPLIDFWNEQAKRIPTKIRPSVHGTTAATNTLQRIDTLVVAYVRGTLLRQFPVETSRCREDVRHPIPETLLTKQWTLEEMKNILSLYFLSYEEGYWPYSTEEKARLPQSLSTVLLSGHAQARPSWFLTTAAHPPKKKDAVQSPETYRVCVQLFTKYNHPPTPIEKQQLAGAANELFREYQQIDKGIIPYCSPTYFERAGSLQKFLGMFSDFLEYLFQNDRDGMQMAAGMLRPGTKTWEAFLRYTEQEFNCPLSLWGVDPEAWAKGRFPLVLMFMRDKVREIGMDRARRRYGNRIPFMAFEEQTAYAEQWKTKHGGRMPLAGEWGRGLYREIMKGEK